MRSLLIVGLLSSLGCAHAFRNSTTVCPEYRDLACTTAPDCAIDRDRGCQVCHCGVAGPVERTPAPQRPLLPDHR